jgi:hypothetical protein
MKFRWLFIIIILIYATDLKSQSNYKPGYIQLASGDTLYGEIDYRTDIQMGTVCRFKSSDMAAVREYIPDEISAYRVDNSRYFVSKDIKSIGGNKKVFLEYLIKGKVDIFYYRDVNDIDHYYIDKQGYGLMELPFKTTYKKVNGANYQFDSKDHIGILKYYLQDAPDFQAQIERIRKPDRENLIKLTEEYQKKVCKDENCIVYERRIPFLKVALNPVIGVLIIRGSNKKVTEVGGLVYFWMPRSNENLYFKTGLVHKSKTDYDLSTLETIENDYYSTYEIPLQIQYQFSSKRFKPVAGIGVNYLIFKHQLSDRSPFHDNKYTDVGHTICLTAGFNYKITNTLALSASLNSDFTPLLFLIDDDQAKFRLLSTSLRIGLYINL